MKKGAKLNGLSVVVVDDENNRGDDIFVLGSSKDGDRASTAERNIFNKEELIMYRFYLFR